MPPPRDRMMTLQAPHSLAPQPKCGPVMPSSPRRMPSSAESGSASTLVSTPLRRNRMLAIVDGTLLGLDLDLRLVAEFLDHFGPFDNIAAQKFVELLWSHRHRNRALFGPELDDVRPLDRGIYACIQFIDDRLRCSRGRHQAKPDGGLIPGHAGFDHGRYVGHH